MARFAPLRLLFPAVLLLAACEPLPHPFAGNVPRPGSRLMALPDTVSLSVAPVGGTPRATAQKLAAAVAAALRRREVPASAHTASIESDELSGRIEELPFSGGSGMAILARWRLANARGRVIGERSARVAAPAKDWQRGAKTAVARLASASADAIARLFLGKAATASLATLPAPKIASSSAASTPEKPAPRAGAARLRLFVRPLEGAPGDGGAALAKAIGFFLREKKIAVVSGTREKRDFVLEGRVAVGEEEAGIEPIKILWRVLRPDGKEIGTVAQQNAVPARLIAGSWGNLAYIIADAAQGGILELLARGASEHEKS